MISKILSILAILTFYSIALGACPQSKSIDLENLFMASKCKGQNCEVLRSRFFEGKNKQVQMNQYHKITIESVQVKQDDRNSAPYLSLTAKPQDNCNTPANGQIVYRHQVLGTAKIQKGLISTRIVLPKKTTLREANEFCMKLSKKCTWKNTINAF